MFECIGNTHAYYLPSEALAEQDLLVDVSWRSRVWNDLNGLSWSLTTGIYILSIDKIMQGYS